MERPSCSNDICVLPCHLKLLKFYVKAKKTGAGYFGQDRLIGLYSTYFPLEEEPLMVKLKYIELRIIYNVINDFSHNSGGRRLNQPCNYDYTLH